jgi:hypothetical protein
MPDLPDASSALSAERCLVIAENNEAAYRYAAVGSGETDIVLASPEGTFSGADGAYSRVIVVGFGGNPVVLATLVDQGFEFAQTVSVGASGPLAPASDEWRSAFAPFRVEGVTEGAFPAVALVREPGDDTGDFVRGALSVLEHWVPRPDLRPVQTNASSPEAPRAKVPPKLSTVGRARQALGRLVKSHRRLVILAAVGGLVVIAVTVGLVALLGNYAVGVLAALVLMLVGLSFVFQEFRGWRLQAAVTRIEERSAMLKPVGSPAKAATLAERLEANSDDLNILQRSLAVVELASLDAAKSLERLEQALKTDRGGRA